MIFFLSRVTRVTHGGKYRRHLYFHKASGDGSLMTTFGLWTPCYDWPRLHSSRTLQREGQREGCKGGEVHSGKMEKTRQRPSRLTAATHWDTSRTFTVHLYTFTVYKTKCILCIQTHKTQMSSFWWAHERDDFLLLRMKSTGSWFNLTKNAPLVKKQELNLDCHPQALC